MKKEVRTICYDEELCLEAYRLEGIVQPFPNHFHEYYVIGIVESGKRWMACRNREYIIGPGDMVLFQPGDNHACAQHDDGTLDYRAINVPQATMRKLTEEVTGECGLPGFSEHVIQNRDMACYLRRLHQMIMEGSREFEKEEELFLLMSQLLARYGQPFEQSIPDSESQVERACEFMHRNYMDHMGLDQICRAAGLSKSTLLRAFTREKGVTPYRYLQTIRIGEAKKLLEQGVSPADAALQTGFTDQSHFTNFFTMFIGLTPGAYREIFQKATGGGSDGR